MISGSGSVVGVTDDTVTATLGKPTYVRGKRPCRTAVLGDNALVEYQDRILVVYENGLSSPGTVLQSVWSMSTDGISRWYLQILDCDDHSKAVFTLDVGGKLCDKTNLDTDTWYRMVDCTVGDGKLWVKGCDNGGIIVMSPQ